MSNVVTHKCDICQAQSTDFSTWSEFTEIDGRRYEVCDRCRNRLFSTKGA